MRKNRQRCYNEVVIIIETIRGRLFFMSQPVAGDNFVSAPTGVGTVVVTNTMATLKRLVWGGTYTGTLTLHDAATAAGTTATSQIVSIGLPAIRFPDSLEINAQCRYGIVYQATGTPSVTIVWS